MRLLIMVLLLLGCSILYNLFGHRLITAMYNGTSPWILNSIIKSHRSHPIEFYYKWGDKVFHHCMYSFLLIMALTYLRNRSIKLNVIIFFILVFCAIYLISFNMALEVTNDSTNYLSCAEHLISGKGFCSRGFDLENSNTLRLTGILKKPIGNAEKHPYVYFGPLYPLLVALPMGMLDISALTSALFINRVFFALLITFIYLLIKEMNTKACFFASIIAALSICINPFVLIFNSAWSEMTYVTLSIISIYYLYKFSTCSQHKESRIMLLCAIFSSLATLCRYLGITVLLTGFIVIFLKKNLPVRMKIKNFLILACALLPLIPWLIRNKIVTGDLGGGYRGPSDKSLVFNLLLAVKTAARDLLLTNNKYIIGFISAFVLALIIYNKKVLWSILNKNFVIVIYFLIYFMSVVSLATMTYFEDIGTRMMVPSYPPLIIVCAGIFITILQNRSEHKKEAKNLE